MEKFMRFMHKGKPASGRVDGDAVRLLDGDFIAGARETGESVPLAAVDDYLPPVVPARLVAVGLNYRDHAEESNLPIPVNPIFFMLSTYSLLGHNKPVRRPEVAQEISYEAEIAIVLGRDLFQVDEKTGLDGIFGYCCANDITARDLQRSDGQWPRSKSYPTFTPLGPWIVTGIDPTKLDIRLTQNGVVKQDSNTANQIFSPGKLVSFISSVMPLSAGDVIITGTPGGVGLVQSGDVMEVTIEGIGALTNKLA